MRRKVIRGNSRSIKCSKFKMGGAFLNQQISRMSAKVFSISGSAPFDTWNGGCAIVSWVYSKFPNFQILCDLKRLWEEANRCVFLPTRSSVKTMAGVERFCLRHRLPWRHWIDSYRGTSASHALGIYDCMRVLVNLHRGLREYRRRILIT